MRTEPELGQLRGAAKPAPDETEESVDLPARPQASPGRLVTWLQAALATDASHAIIVGAALLLSSVALTLGLTIDDHFQTVALRGNRELAGIDNPPWDLFAYAKDQASVIALRNEGVYPWWTSLDARIAFMRPISSLSIWLDHRLWPDRPALMHLHSLAWFAVLLWIVGRIYRATSGASLASGVALAIFAFDDARATTVGWICNRNALIALVFGFGALLAHVRWRRDGNRVAGRVAPLLLLLGLLSGESALQVCGYLFAYTLCFESGDGWKRLRSLLPYGIVLVGWRVLYVSLGYGTFGSGHYIDPGRDLTGFVRAAGHRLPLLLAAQFTGLFADIGDGLPLLMPSAVPYLLPLCLLLLLLFALLVRPLWGHASVRFWTIGCVLATLPVCGVSPADRVLTATALGGAALLAILLVELLERSYPHRSKLTTGAGLVLTLIHLVVAPMLLPVRIKAIDHFETLLGAADRTVPSDPSIRQKTLVLLNPPVDPFAFYFPLYRAARGIARPQRLRWLTTGVSAFDVARVDANTLKIHPHAGFLSSPSHWVMRNPKLPAVVGESVQLEGVRFQVTALTPDARPAEVTVRFDQSLESEQLVWLQWDQHGYVPFQPPVVGSSVTIPAVDLVQALF